MPVEFGSGDGRHHEEIANYMITENNYEEFDGKDFSKSIKRT